MERSTTMDIRIEAIASSQPRDRAIRSVRAELKTQLGVSSYLRRIGEAASESYRNCQELYRRAYDTLVRLGEDRKGFPKSI